MIKQLSSAIVATVATLLVAVPAHAAAAAPTAPVPAPAPFHDTYRVTLSGPIPAGTMVTIGVEQQFAVFCGDVSPCHDGTYTYVEPDYNTPEATHLFSVDRRGGGHRVTFFSATPRPGGTLTAWYRFGPDTAAASTPAAAPVPATGGTGTLPAAPAAAPTAPAVPATGSSLAPVAAGSGALVLLGLVALARARHSAQA